MKISPVEREIDEIRLRIYERTKDMTMEERREYYRKRNETFAKKYGLKIISSADDV